jgi:ubiquinone/menaquinone biosynthesis C-methylase UbiE
MKTKTIDLKQYNSVAEKYSEEVLNFNQESIHTYFKYLNSMDLRRKKVLDLGCGNGYDLSQISIKDAVIYGLDSSTEMVKLARKQNPKGKIEIGRFDEIPFPDKSFDLVISKWALQTSAEIDPIYEEIIRVLKPGGRLLYLACHPLRQFLEKKTKGKNYFVKETVTSVFFNGQITALEPSHSLNEYLSPFFFKHFMLEAYEEGLDSAAEKIDGDVYPSFFIIQAVLKKTL